MIGLVDGNNFFVSCERVFNRRLVGRPVAVLSNNDGCCVARSNEFKALGIPMGTPYFQLRGGKLKNGPKKTVASTILEMTKIKSARRTLLKGIEIR